MSPSPDVAVVIPAREASETLGATLEAVRRQDFDGEVEIVVAVPPDDASTRRVVSDAALHDPRIRLVDNPAGTTPAALEVAIAATTAAVIVRCDAHAILPPHYIATAVRVLNATGAGNVGGRQVPIAESGFGAAVAAAMRSPLGSGGATYRTGSVAGPVETAYLGVFRREALEDVGGFDLRLLRNQDYELNHRLRQAGWVVWFDPNLAVAYRPRDSVCGLARQYWDYGVYKRLVVEQHPSSIRVRQVAPVAMVAGVVTTGVLSLAAGRLWPFLGASSGYLGGVAVAAMVSDRRRAPSVAVALVTMHWSWALGFLRGSRPRRTAERRGPRRLGARNG